MALSEDDYLHLAKIESRLRRAAPGPWRNTIRSENGKEMVEAIIENGGIGVSRCSQSVVNTQGRPTAGNVICWMGPAAGVNGDDLHDAEFIAYAREDVEWLLAKVSSLAGIRLDPSTSTR